MTREDAIRQLNVNRYHYNHREQFVCQMLMRHPKAAAIYFWYLDGEGWSTTDHDCPGKTHTSS
jgi:hypothetical protein